MPFQYSAHQPALYTVDPPLLLGHAYVFDLGVLGQ
jgi:hypothetical protein